MIEVLRFWVPGNPKTKGSLKVLNSGRLSGRAVLQDTPTSKRWRQLVAVRARDAMGAAQLAPVLRETGKICALAGPVALRVEYFLPVSGHRLIEQGSGDVDKLDRNVLDALQDANLYDNDSQVVRCWSDKLCADVGTGGRSPGAEIVVSVWG